MHRDDDKATGSPGRGSAHPGTNPAGLCLPNGSPWRDPYNTVRPLDVVAWEPPVAATVAESVTMWTDENGLDCYTSVLEMDDAR